MLLATWNVNSIRTRREQVADWLGEHRPDVLCLQETKCRVEDFPASEFESLGYRCAVSGNGGYCGVAILSRSGLDDVSVAGLPDDLGQCRLVAATVSGVRVICAYIPNGQSVDSDKYVYKMNWLRHFHQRIRDEMANSNAVAVLGDYNIAPSDEDVHDPESWGADVPCSPPEREAFRALLGLGFADAFRLFPKEPGAFTWWDYRQGGFRRNRGLRIDHILLTGVSCSRCDVDKAPRALERPSDHAPVFAEIALN